MKNKITIIFVLLSVALFGQKDCLQILENGHTHAYLTEGVSKWHFSPPDTLTYWFSPAQWDKMLEAEAAGLKWTDGEPYVARVLVAPNGVQFTKLCNGLKPCTDFEDNRLVCQVIVSNGIDKITDLPKKKN